MPARIAALFGFFVFLGMFPGIAGCGSVNDVERTETDSHPDTGPPLGMAVSVPAPLADVVGLWYLDRDGMRFTLSLAVGSHGVLEGRLATEPDEAGVVVEALAYDERMERLSFEVKEAAHTRFYRLDLRDGVARGRDAQGQGGAPPIDPTDWRGHVVGWRRDTFDAELAPRAYDLLIDGTARARLRIDRGAPGTFIGRLKIYVDEAHPRPSEEPSSDLEILAWDGVDLRFVRHGPAGDERFVAVVRGRRLTGAVTGPGPRPSRSVTGERAEVLAYGLSPRSPEAREGWQALTRRRLEHLVLAGNPAPLTTEVKSLGEATPIAPAEYQVDRDDDPLHHPPAYTLHELSFTFTLLNPSGGAPLRRVAHGWLARPNGPAPPEGYVPVLALNGHAGSAALVFDPTHEWYWYGDGFARRGAVVLAIDISHRPVEDRGGVYDHYETGDDPAQGNGSHPAIEAPGMDSDFTEDGERAWDAMRGIDYLLSLPDVNRRALLVAGLSLGGAITQITSALDTRVAAVVGAGYIPELANLIGIYAHECWRWAHGNILEFVDFAAYDALIAPRLLVVESGRIDFSASFLPPPFASDKEVVRRVRAAYADVPRRLVHYLHDGAHLFRFGDRRTDETQPLGITVPLWTEPELEEPWDERWAADAETLSLGTTLPEALSEALGLTWRSAE